MKIAVDLDEVLGEFIREFLVWYNQKYQTIWTFEDVSDYHWSNWMNITSEQAVNDVHEFFKTDDFANLPVVDGAREGIIALSKNHQLYLVTARQNVVSNITKEWINKNFPDTFQEIVHCNHYPTDGAISRPKGEICIELGCEIIIEDNLYHADDLLNSNVRMILLIKPWNKNSTPSSRIMKVNNWPEILVAIDAITQTSVTA